MRTVTLKMQDELNEVEVSRTIDISNIMVAGSGVLVIGTEEQQRDQLNRWINERGNDQHNTILTLLSWEVNAAQA